MEIVVVKQSNKKDLFNIDYNNSSEPCLPCKSECEKINKKINGQKLSKIKNTDIPHILKVFDL
ncbi:MAG: hypothetical protein CMI76_00940 [Candidatus Pelagibacter sp.]|nr:hypothetical protein [Candidatus Pelagibacter sp.]|tara:strand:+ start:126 stop:314 length:189 start_codon:yes stop_codon:yes gene_type:complete